MIVKADARTRQVVYVKWLMSLDEATVSQYGAQRFKSRDIATHRQRIHPVFV